MRRIFPLNYYLDKVHSKFYVYSSINPTFKSDDFQDSSPFFFNEVHSVTSSISSNHFQKIINIQSMSGRLILLAEVIFFLFVLESHISLATAQASLNLL